MIEDDRSAQGYYPNLTVYPHILASTQPQTPACLIYLRSPASCKSQTTSSEAVFLLGVFMRLYAYYQLT